MRMSDGEAASISTFLKVAIGSFVAVQLVLWLAAVFVFVFPGSYLLDFYKLIPSGVIYSTGNSSWVIAFLHFTNGMSAIFGYLLTLFFIHLVAAARSKTVKFIFAMIAMSTFLAAVMNSLSVMILIIGGVYYLIALLISVCSMLSYTAVAATFIIKYDFICQACKNSRLVSD